MRRIEAARLSKAAQRPVRVAWTRGRRVHAQAFCARRPSRAFAVRSGGNAIAAWDQQTAGGFVLFAFFPTPLRWVFGTDFGATRAARSVRTPSADHACQRGRSVSYRSRPDRGAGWASGRTCLLSSNGIDELAAAAGVDPLEFRLRHLRRRRRGRAHEARAAKRRRRQAGWGRPLSDGQRARYRLLRTTAAPLSPKWPRLRVDRASGAVRVDAGGRGCRLRPGYQP